MIDFRKSSLATQILLLLSTAIVISTVPLVLYFLSASRELSTLGSDPRIDAGLERAIDLSESATAKYDAAMALKQYRQIGALRARVTRNVILFSIVYAGAVILVSLGIGFKLVARITRPLRELTEATRRVAADDLDRSLPEPSGAEVAQLVRSFNRMAEDLKTAREQRALAERRATWRNAARTIAHEIKNPLTPIKLSTERLYEKYLAGSPDFDKVIRSTVSTVLEEIGNLQKLVDTFHRYAKYPDPAVRNEDISRIATETVELFSAGDIPVNLDIRSGSATASLDGGQLREALANLIKNAIEAAEVSGRPDPRVLVTVASQGKEIVVTVADNGNGIAAEYRKRVFQPYFTTKKHGSGIGLALTERIITVNGGIISFETVEGTGTTFTLKFPSAPEAGPPGDHKEG